MKKAANKKNASLKSLSFGEGFGVRFYLLLFTLSLASCSFNPRLQGKGETYLQGEWQQDSSAVQHKLVTYTSNHFRFTCDSFYLKINTFSKVNYGADTCMNKGRWTEYVRGTYAQRNDTLFLRGQFCDDHYRIKETQDCLRAGNYDELFSVSNKSDSLLQLSGTSSVIPIGLRLQKRTGCTPKAL
ncbi:hypothetical protein C8P68_102692 [Mucilaginibacter yixingensis]|uniref:Fumarate hydratase n=1 Tax=Mucilaginibacter yixingensis TaxID=1295612 RepID=A0A2T5JDL8_9SPHI|nr:hypothetical protein C8P68_102692 [Mucilaginibacter yixingensis]